MSTYINFLIASMVSGVLAVASSTTAAASPAQSELWEAPAEWHRLLKKPVRGTLVAADDAIEFRSAMFSQRWTYPEIHSFNLSPTGLTLTSYQNRPWHEPGERTFHFTWSKAMPPEIAADLAARVGKPVRNGIPWPSVAAWSEIPAHRRMWSGGSDGKLRFRDGGIDYVTESGPGSLAWRWADIQTIANPNPYEFRVTGYRDIVEFDLKRPLSRQVFERAWDDLYGAGLDLAPGPSGERQ